MRGYTAAGLFAPQGARMPRFLCRWLCFCLCHDILLNYLFKSMLCRGALLWI